MKLSAFLLLATCTTPVVQATYSIAATDQANQLVGGAGASCVQDDDIGLILYHGVPGKGVLHTQAVALEADSEAVTTGIEQIEQGLDPATILQNMNDLDAGTGKGRLFGLGDDIPNSELRQNAIANLNGQHAGHTGASIDALYVNVLGIVGSNQSHDGGAMGDYTYTAQGNVVTNNTVGALLEGFSGEGCDLPEKLMNAMEAVSQAGAGDERCILAQYEPAEVDGVPAAGGFIKVQAPNGDYIIDINVIGDGSVDPTIELREKFDAWRADNPCAGGAPAGETSTEGGATTAPEGGATTAPEGTSGASSQGWYLVVASSLALMAMFGSF